MKGAVRGFADWEFYSHDKHFNYFIVMYLYLLIKKFCYAMYFYFVCVCIRVGVYEYLPKEVIWSKGMTLTTASLSQSLQSLAYKGLSKSSV